MRDANIEDPEGKNIDEATQLHLNTYKIIEQSPESLDDKLTAAGLFIYPDVNAEAKAEQPASKPPTPQPPSHESLTERMQRFADNPTRFYAMIGAGLGVLLVVIFAAVNLLPGSPEGRYDLGPVTSSATGLKGHLYINWEKTLHYQIGRASCRERG